RDDQQYRSGRRESPERVPQDFAHHRNSHSREIAPPESPKHFVRQQVARSYTGPKNRTTLYSVDSSHALKNVHSVSCEVVARSVDLEDIAPALERHLRTIRTESTQFELPDLPMCSSLGLCRST